ncbi:MAG: hypothetical protein ACPGO3_05445 [Magnetospiraceae bacterium]
MTNPHISTQVNSDSARANPKQPFSLSEISQNLSASAAYLNRITDLFEISRTEFLRNKAQEKVSMTLFEETLTYEEFTEKSAKMMPEAVSQIEKEFANGELDGGYVSIEIQIKELSDINDGLEKIACMLRDVSANFDEFLRFDNAK